MSDDIPLPVNTGKPQEKKKFFDGSRRPNGKWAMVALAAGVLALAAVAMSFINMSKHTDASKVEVKDVGGQMPKGDATLPGGKGTLAYNEKMQQQSTNQAGVAEQKGTSYVAPPAGQTQAQPGSMLANAMGGTPANAANPMPAATPEMVQQQTQAQQQQAAQQQQRADAIMQSMMMQLKGIDDRLGTQFRAQTVTTYKDKGDLVKDGNNAHSSGVQAANASTMNKSPVKPGLLVYASNDILLSTEGSTGARATVLNGQFKRWVLLGTFAHSDTSLKIQYSTLVAPDGTDYSVSAYAVSPDTDSAAIATEVNNHNLERWGGLVAAAFLQGFGNATLLSGTQNVGGVPGATGVTGVNGATAATVGYGYITQVPTLSLMQKGAVALGTVGSQVANILSKNFNRPPTITLNAGEPIGVLFVK